MCQAPLLCSLMFTMTYRPMPCYKSSPMVLCRLTKPLPLQPHRPQGPVLHARTMTSLSSCLTCSNVCAVENCAARWMLTSDVGASSLGELKTALSAALTAIAAGQVQPVIHKSNSSKLAHVAIETMQLARRGSARALAVIGVSDDASCSSCIGTSASRHRAHCTWTRASGVHD